MKRVIVWSAAVLTVASSTWADVINVPGDAPTIQAAIQAANDGDEIVLADGTYGGDGFRGIVLPGFAFDALTIRSANGPGQTIIDLGGTHRFMDFVSAVPETVVLDGLTLRDGSGVSGGALRVRFNSAPTIRNCRFESCTATGLYQDEQGGGAVLIDRGSPRFESCTFEGNHTNGFGAGILFLGPGTPMLDDCTFHDNRAALGGAMMWIANGAKDASTISRCTFSANRGDLIPFESAGGAVLCFEGAQVDFDRCLFRDNIGPIGGGLIVANDAVVRVMNTVFHGNHAPAYDGAGAGELGGGGVGGAVFTALGGELTAYNCTFADNRADVAGGAVASSGNGSAHLVGSIVWDNDAAIGASLATPIVFENAGVLRVRFSAVEGGAAGVHLEPGGELDWQGGNLDVAPRFVDATAHDYRLKPNSPCIDAGDLAAFPSRFDLDFGAAPRFHDDPGTVDTGESGDAPGGTAMIDIGAHEFQGTSPACPADLDGSGSVDFEDVMTLIAAWGACPGVCPPDLDGDGDVDFSDLLTLLDSWSCTP